MKATQKYRAKPLYRKINRRTHSLGHGLNGGAEYRWTRNAKEATRDAAEKGALGDTHYHGLDYTPLFRFLLSRVGRPWEPTLREALSRLPDPVRGEARGTPVFCMVFDPAHDRELEFMTHGRRRGIFAASEFSLFSALEIDAEGVLQKSVPDLGPQHISPFCPCHTHTFNGTIVTNICRNPYFQNDPKLSDGEHWKGYVRYPR